MPPVPIEEVTPDNPRFLKPKRRTISLRWLLALVFGSLLAISVFSVLAVSVGANLSNTFSLLNASSVRILSNVETTIRDQILQAERVIQSVAEIYREGNFELDDIESQEIYLRSLMRAAPIVQGLLIYDMDGRKTGMMRNREGNFIKFYGNIVESAEILKMFNVTPDRDEEKTVFGRVTEYNGQFYENISVSIMRNNKLQGVVVALIGLDAINRLIGQIGTDIDTPVFLMDGNSMVIAYSKMPKAFLSGESIPLQAFPDEALKELLKATPSDEFEFAKKHGIEVISSPGRNGRIFLLKNLGGFEHDAFKLGVHFSKNDFKSEFIRIATSAIMGLGTLILAVLIAIFLGRRLAEPMGRIARAADHFSNFELEKFVPLPHSRIQEIDDQAKALNSMHTALSEFSQYVPKTVVQRLLQSGKDANRSVEREVTIMFSDIVGFTSMSEHLNAVETAKLLNDHFDMICKAIDETNGTVDKFIGDSVMAFWGAPNADDHHAKNAVRAAEGIARGLSKMNTQRIEQNLAPIRLRIGIHTGRVIVGNIGGGDRQNYTLVGDNVNVGQRLEQLGKSFMEERKLIVLASEKTVTSSGMVDSFEPAGSQMLRGRETPISVFALKTEEASILPAGQIITSDIA